MRKAAGLSLWSVDAAQFTPLYEPIHSGSSALMGQAMGRKICFLKKLFIFPVS